MFTFVAVLSALLLGICMGAALGAWFSGPKRPIEPPLPTPLPNPHATIRFRADGSQLRDGLRELRGASDVLTGPWRRP